MTESEPLPPNATGPEAAFRYALDPPPEGGGEAAVEEAIRSELESLLEIIVLMNGGQPVEVDSFAFVHEPEGEIKLRPSPRFQALIER